MVAVIQILQQQKISHAIKLFKTTKAIIYPFKESREAIIF
jgi:hypothetical protein